MNTISFLILTLLNYFVILMSENIDLNQLYVEVNNAFIIQITLDNLKIIASSLISVVTIILLKVFHPFIEIYLLHYYKFSFYLLVNLSSLSSVYIVLRIYGYSRFILIIYLVVSTFTLLILEKIKRRLN
jgi:hypothetical protein